MAQKNLLRCPAVTYTSLGRDVAGYLKFNWRAERGFQLGSAAALVITRTVSYWWCYRSDTRPSCRGWCLLYISRVFLLSSLYHRIHAHGVLVYSRRRFLRGVPRQFTEAHLPWKNRPFTESVPHLRELTSSFAESVKNSQCSPLHACICMH